MRPKWSIEITHIIFFLFFLTKLMPRDPTDDIDHPQLVFLRKSRLILSILPLFHQGSAGSEPEPSFKSVLRLSTRKALALEPGKVVLK